MNKKILTELEIAYNQLNYATSQEAIDRAIFRINMAERELVIKRNNAKQEN